jgi:putrescine aminotransferase
MVLDEVQTGFGRTGKWFGCDHWNVSPDIMVLAKALGGGLPLGAFIGRREVMETLSNPMLSHLTTFGGNPVCCAAAKAAIQIMQRDDLPGKAAQRGEEFMAGLRAMQERYPSVIREVRGKGLLIGIELNSKDVMAKFVNEVHAQCLIIGDSLNDDITARLEPPLTISDQEVEAGLSRLEYACRETAKRCA